MLGGLLVKLAFVSCLVSIGGYLYHLRSGNARGLTVGRIFFHGMVVTVLVTSALLLYLILTHQFQYTYVWSYSSRELPLPLLISTFYAGQEGSFMLWTLYTAIIGVFLLRYSSLKGYEPQVMPVYGLIALVLLLLLIIKNPFAYVWETWSGEVAPGFLPPNGRGLNPLLQNYWMVIHPQVLFSGFAAMGVPYAYAVAALIKRDYVSWIKPATPWLVFGSMILGTGIILGGFWAYETLGWGGYWGWDPVENSSLVPWLLSVAGIHMMLSQRKSGSFIRTNLALSMLCFIFVLYSTFLTRSGVLGETSVHSFVDPGMWAYILLLGMLILFTLIGAGALVARWKEIPRPATNHHVLSREFMLFLGASALVASALLVSAGTSSPIITEILYGKKSAVDISFYVTTNLPIGIALGVLVGLGQLLWWNRSRGADLLRTLRIPVLASLGITAVLAALGVRDLLVALFLFGAAFALVSNAMVGWNIVRGNPRFAGGAVAHIGLAIMFFGFAASSKYDSKQTVSLKRNQTVEALGYQLTYTGYRPIDGEKFAFNVRVTKDGKEFSVSPVMYFSSYNEGLMRNPDIVNLITKDFYLAPLSLEQPGVAPNPDRSELRQGESKQFGSLDLAFLGVDRPVFRQASGGGRDPMRVRLGYRLQGQPPAALELIESAGNAGFEPVLVQERFRVRVSGLAADAEGRPLILAEVTDLMAQNTSPGPEADADILVAEASVKPFINLVWSGVIVLVVGFLVTMVRRVREARMKDQKPDAGTASENE